MLQRNILPDSGATDAAAAAAARLEVLGAQITAAKLELQRCADNRFDMEKILGRACGVVDLCAPQKRVSAAAAQFYQIALTEASAAQTAVDAARHTLEQLELDAAATTHEYEHAYAAAQRTGLYSLPVELLSMIIGFTQRGVTKAYAEYMLRRPKNYIMVTYQHNRLLPIMCFLNKHPLVWLNCGPKQPLGHTKLICDWPECDINEILREYDRGGEDLVRNKYKQAAEILANAEHLVCRDAQKLCTMLICFSMPKLISVWVQGITHNPRRIAHWTRPIRMASNTLLLSMPCIIWSGIVTVVHDGIAEKHLVQLYNDVKQAFGPYIYRPRVRLTAGCDPADYTWADIVK